MDKFGPPEIGYFEKMIKPPKRQKKRTVCHPQRTYKDRAMEQSLAQMR